MNNHRSENKQNILSIRLTDDVRFLAEQVAKSRVISLADFIRQQIIAGLEDEFDVKAFEEAHKEYTENPKTYTFEEMERIVDAKKV